MKKHIITLAGKPGSGKSSTGTKLAQVLGYKRFSMGDLQRKYSEELGMDFASYSEMQKTDHTIDKKVDEYQKEVGEKEGAFVLDSRLGWYFIPQSFKVLLDLPAEIAVDRIMKDAESNPTRKVEKVETREDMITAMNARIDSEKTRYKDLYGIENHFDVNNFDLIVNTEHHTLEDVVGIIQTAYEKWLQE
jgi:CMP/dCMP kinase